MERHSAQRLSPLVWTIAAGLMAIVLVLAAWGWMQHGTGIFLAMAQSGMAWCF